MMKIIESPREGMQGFSRIIPTAEKARYINSLLRVGFDVVETGSLVSPKFIPQMADSMEVLKKLDLTGVSTGVMFLAAGNRGAEALASVDEITHISYPFSISPAFLLHNLNTTMEESLQTAGKIVNLCTQHGKQAVIYISMAFGNPYGDPWNISLLVQWVGELYKLGVRTIPLSNVSIQIGAKQIADVYSTLLPLFPDVEFGLHLHTSGDGWHDKVNAAYLAGCRRFDGVLTGLGGCPMAGGVMLGNLKTEYLVEFAGGNNIPLNIDKGAMEEMVGMAEKVFSNIEY